jgi:putative methionine-R-sulfoxide reductase with GAF domain
VDAQVVADVRNAARAGGSAEERASRAADLIRSRTGRRWVGIYRIIDDKVMNLAWSGVGPPSHPSFAIGQGLTGAAIRAGKTVVSNDVGGDPRYLTNQESTGSELIAPVLLNGRIVGTLDIEDAATDAFDDSDQSLFELLAAALSDLYR